MPVCRDCSNTEAFMHFVDGRERRYYNADGSYRESDYVEFHTQEVRCDECASLNVEFE